MGFFCTNLKYRSNFLRSISLLSRFLRRTSSVRMAVFTDIANGQNPYLLVAIPLLALISYYIRVYTRLRHIPGPVLASLSNLPRRSWVQTGNSHNILLDLHRKYGKVVRFGPNAILISDPACIAEVYGLNAKFRKVGARVSLRNFSCKIGRFRLCYHAC